MHVNIYWYDKVECEKIKTILAASYPDWTIKIVDIDWEMRFKIMKAFWGNW